MSQRVPSRTIQLVQPSSPFSPRMDSYQMPSPQRRPRTGRTGTSSSGGLKLPSLPRFHPANFPSQQTTASNTPITGPNSPQPPLSPRTQQRQYSDAQRQLYLYQRELMNGLGTRAPAASGGKPTSPRLIPMGSPGPVTPLELEDQASDYLMAGGATTAGSQGELVEKLIREERKRSGQPSSPRASTSVGG